jgi:glycosyltransferase involved in cell wall biosynthesis
MRLLMTVDSVGGVWQYGLDLARALSERRVETVLAHMGPAPTAAQQGEASAIAGARLVETGLPLDWLVDGPQPMIDAGAAITQLARDERVDLVQINMPTLGAAVRADVPVIAVAHGCVSTWWQAARAGEPLASEFHWHRRMSAEGLRAADAVVAPTAAYAQLIAREYGLSFVPVAVHNGRTPIARPGRGSAGTGVFTAGRLWDHAKDAALMNRVASRLSEPFHAAGPVTGPNGETVSFDQLHLLGCLDTDALRHWLDQRPIFVSAARFEPFGLAVLEAAQAGCPLILSDIPTLAMPHFAKCLARPLATGLHATRPRPWPTTCSGSTAAPCIASARHEDRLLHPLAAILLEPRQCAFPARRAERAWRPRARCAGL